MELFFALSGYLITSLLLAERDRTGRIDLQAFYLRRALRLAPALLAFVAVMAPALYLLGNDQALVEGLVAATYTMDVYAPLHDSARSYFSHTWSLAVEEQFYLVWPALLVLGLARGWRLRRVVAALALGCAAIGVGLTWGWSPLVAYPSPFPHVPVLLGGAALAMSVHRGRRWVRHLGHPLIPIAAAAAAVAGWMFVDQKNPALCGGVLLAVAASLVALVGHLVVRPDSATARLLNVRPLTWLGKRSYGFYLWHVVPAYALLDMGVRQYIRGPVAIAGALLLTVLSWVLVEQPFLHVKRRFSR